MPQSQNLDNQTTLTLLNGLRGVLVCNREALQDMLDYIETGIAVIEEVRARITTMALDEARPKRSKGIRSPRTTNVLAPETAAYPGKSQALNFILQYRREGSLPKKIAQRLNDAGLCNKNRLMWTNHHVSMEIFYHEKRIKEAANKNKETPS